jgi:nucleoside-diphosphate-sugar epimerase
MRVLILGMDGYLGWPLALRLLARGHEVAGIDNLYTRKAVEEVGSASALPIPSPEERVHAVRDIMGKDLDFIIGDITKYSVLNKAIRKFKPDTVVHFAEQRSAPYSMIDVKHANFTMRNNLSGTLNLIYAVKKANPKVHVVKMGTMGEYGTPNFDIPESAFVDAQIGGKSDRIVVPKWAGSWYHWSKVHDTNNLLFANKVWGITTTDIMQGPVYGTRTKEITDDRLFTRFDFDGVWGTVFNRYCVESVLGMPLTQYGKGGQTRAFLSLEDSMESLRLLIENRPNDGEYRVVNQFTEVYSVRELALIAKEVASKNGMSVEIGEVDNPRVEANEHYYKPVHDILPALGLKSPTRNIRDEMGVILKDLQKHKSRLAEYKDAIMPEVRWKD